MKYKSFSCSGFSAVKNSENSLTLCSPVCSLDCCHLSGNTLLCWNAERTDLLGYRCLHGDRRLKTQVRKVKTTISVYFNRNLFKGFHILPLVERMLHQWVSVATRVCNMNSPREEVMDDVDDTMAVQLQCFNQVILVLTQTEPPFKCQI